MSDVTRILEAVKGGDKQAANDLLPLVYDELRKLAAARLAEEKPGLTIDATSLVHEAYLRLVGSGTPSWNSQGHFFKAAAESMRRILVERARQKRRIKHGGGRKREPLDEANVADDAETDQLLALDEALDLLAKEDQEVADVVKLRYFAGLTIQQAADSLNISERTVNRHWNYARAFLFARIA